MRVLVFRGGDLSEVAQDGILDVVGVLDCVGNLTLQTQNHVPPPSVKGRNVKTFCVGITLTQPTNSRLQLPEVLFILENDRELLLEVDFYLL